jgi:hypothetical protein
MKQFYMSTSKTCVLNLIVGGGGGGASNQWEVFFIIKTFPMESLSFSSLLIHENKIKIGTSLDRCVYVNT